jgi:hypothetical protein
VRRGHRVVHRGTQRCLEQLDRDGAAAVENDELRCEQVHDVADPAAELPPLASEDRDRFGIAILGYARELFVSGIDGLGRQFAARHEPGLLALLHDVFILAGIFSILGRVFNLAIGEIDAFFVTAVLTVVGFSVHDTIVVFDRIRENLRVSQRLSFEQVVNLSIMQTTARSIITSFTVVLVLAAILIAGGPTLQGLALALMIGIVSGTYSSIFNAAPLLVVWRRVQPLR